MVADLLPLFEHSKKAKSRRQTYGQSLENENPPAGLWLVKDAGVYMISNGYYPKDQKIPFPTAYAMGFGEDTYLGGDDFVEFIPGEAIENAVELGAVSIGVTLTETEMSLTYTK
jgi:hypothetical protein